MYIIASKIQMKITSIDLFPNSAQLDQNIYKQAAAQWSLCPTSGRRNLALDPKAAGHIARGPVDSIESHTHCVCSKKSRNRCTHLLRPWLDSGTAKTHKVCNRRVEFPSLQTFERPAYIDSAYNHHHSV